MKLKIFYAIATTFIVSNLIIVANADNKILRNSVKLLPDGSSTLTMTIPLDRYDYFYVLPSTDSYDIFNGGRSIVRMYNEENKDFIYEGKAEDVEVRTKREDKELNVIYKIPSVLKNSPFKLIRFPNILGKDYPRNSITTLEFPENYKILSFGSNSYVSQSLSTSPISFELSSRLGNSYDIESVTVLAAPKTLPPGYIIKKVGNFSIIGNTSFVNRIAEVIDNMPYLNDLFSQTLGLEIPNDIIILISDLSNSGSSYESIGIAIYPNLILLDFDILSFDSNDIKKVITHEITHILVNQHGLFSKSIYNANWFNEGLAVFTEYYLLDKFLIKNQDDLEKDWATSGYRKFTREGLKKQYEKPFDYNFDNADSILNSYSHSGSLIYTLYLEDNDILKKLFSRLLNKRPDIDCKTCDTDVILNEIRGLTNKNNEEILFPGGKDLLLNESLIKNITRETLSEEREKQILIKEFKDNVKKNKVVDNTNLNKKKVDKPSLPTVPIEEKENKVINKATTTPIILNVSKFDKIKLRLINNSSLIFNKFINFLTTSF